MNESEITDFEAIKLRAMDAGYWLVRHANDFDDLDSAVVKAHRHIFEGEPLTVFGDVSGFLPADECLKYDPETCNGPVEYHTVGSSLKAFPRCTFHQERRLDRYENSIERYADSDVEPDWFDPSIAGERWSDD